MGLRLTLLGSVAGCLIASGALAADAGPAVGDVAPDFTARDLLTREPVTLSQQQGKLVFLTFFASWCPPCRKEVPILEGVQRRLGKERAAVLAVGFRENNEQLVRKWARDNHLELSLLEDSSGRVARMYGVHAIPHLYIIGRDGHVLHVHTGYGPDSLDHLVGEINAALRDSGESEVAAAPTAEPQ
ncbi:MAG: TlpA disulfide reductase family protein [Steroidobacteraceae bacterium]|jgi:peroxiredoxin